MEDWCMSQKWDKGSRVVRQMLLCCWLSIFHNTVQQPFCMLLHYSPIRNVFSYLIQIMHVLNVHDLYQQHSMCTCTQASKPRFLHNNASYYSYYRQEMVHCTVYACIDINKQSSYSLAELQHNILNGQYVGTVYTSFVSQCVGGSNAIINVLQIISIPKCVYKLLYCRSTFFVAKLIQVLLF